MSPHALAATPRRSGGARVGVAAAGMATVGWAATGLLAALPAGAGLTAVAAADLSTHRFSTRTLGVASALVAVALVVDAASRDRWGRLAVVVAGVVALGGLLTLAWLATRGLAFGDVLLTTFTIAVPLFVSARSAVLALGATAVAAGGVVLVQAARRGEARQRTVALGPALLAGWLIALMFG